jgi:hypothetical protein
VQYWLQTYTKVIFPQHLEMLKGFYCNPQPCGQSKGGKNMLLLFLQFFHNGICMLNKVFLS